MTFDTSESQKVFGPVVVDYHQVGGCSLLLCFPLFSFRYRPFLFCPVLIFSFGCCFVLIFTLLYCSVLFLSFLFFYFLFISFYSDNVVNEENF